MLTIRKVIQADIPLIRELTFKVWPQTYTPILGTEQVAYMLDMMYSREMLETQMGNGHQFLLCYSDGEPAAFASFSAVGNDIVKLHKIYIIPDQQRKGVGQFIIHHIGNEMAAKGFSFLELNVNKYNYTARSFYEKMGFVLYKAEDIDIGGGYFMNDYVLRLSIGQ